MSVILKCKSNCCYWNGQDGPVVTKIDLYPSVPSIFLHQWFDKHIYVCNFMTKLSNHARPEYNCKIIVYYHELWFSISISWSLTEIALNLPLY